MTKAEHEQKNGKMVRIRWDVYQVCEARAVAKRRKTGRQVFWTTELHAIIDKALKQ